MMSFAWLSVIKWQMTTEEDTERYFILFGKPMRGCTTIASIPFALKSANDFAIFFFFNVSFKNQNGIAVNSALGVLSSFINASTVSLTFLSPTS